MWRNGLLLVLTLATVAGTAFAGPATQYRGPSGEAPRALLPPSADGPIGVERLVSRSRQVEGLTRWEFWWELNRDRFLRRAIARSAEAATGGLLISMWADARQVSPLVDETDVRMRIVSLLCRRLRSADPEDRALAAVALGRTQVSAAFGPLKRLFVEGARSDRRAASIALGLLREPLAAPLLAGFLGSKGAPAADRAYAALGLGLLEARESAPVIRKILAASLGSHGRAVDDFQSAAATALGLLRDEAAVPLLGRIALRRGGIDDKPRAAAVIALGRIGGEAALKVLARALKANDVEVRRATAQALGLTGRPEAKTSLFQALTGDSDIQVRNFAVIALARLGGPGAAEAISMGLSPRNPRALRGFSALALGVVGDRSKAPKLRELLTRKDESSLVGAAALGLAILGDRQSIDALSSIACDETRDDDLRGYATLALVMLGDRVTASRLPKVLKSADRADLRRSAALSLGLALRMRAGPSLLRALLEDPDGIVRGAAINSLAYAPRQAVLPMLLDVAGQHAYHETARKDALAALGVMASRGAPSALERLFDGMNYRSLTASLRYVTELF